MPILKINNANPGVKRPIKVEDLANIWEGLDNALATGVYGTPRIICGFDVGDDYNLTAGVIAFQGKLYLYDATTPITVDAYLYGAEISTGDNRTMGDGTTQLFSYARKVVTQPTGNVLIGEATYENLDLWKAAYIPTGGVTSDMIADFAVTPIKLANNSISTPKLQDFSVTTQKIGTDAVTSSKIANGAVTRNKIANEAVGTTQLKYGASRRNFRVFNNDTTLSKIPLTSEVIHSYYFSSGSSVSLHNFDVSPLSNEPGSNTELYITNNTTGSLYINFYNGTVRLIQYTLSTGKGGRFFIVASDENTYLIAYTDLLAVYTGTN